MDAAPKSRAHRVRLRVSESQVSAALGVVLLFFFIDGFIRDATWISSLLLIAIGAFIVIGLLHIADPSSVRRIEVSAIVTSIIGTLAVGMAVRSLAVSSVIAAAVVGVVAGLLPRVCPRITPAMTAPLYVGAFAGMTSPVVLLGPQWLVLAAVITGCVWSVARDAWIGVGGKMGTIAFVGVAITTVIAIVTGNSGGAAPLDSYGLAEVIIVLTTSVVAAVVTHWLAFKRGLGPVLASALPIAVVAIAAWCVRQYWEFPNEAMIGAWFGASFVGMTAPARLTRRWALPAMALVFGLLLLMFQASLAGLGGDLGATAAAAVICIIGIEAASTRRPWDRPASPRR